MRKIFDRFCLGVSSLFSPAHQTPKHPDTQTSKRPNAQTPKHPNIQTFLPAFTLIEVNLAMLIMAGGILSVVGLYALGFRENRQGREDVAAAVRQIRRDEAKARRAAKDGLEPDSSLLSEIARGKSELLEKIRAERWK